MPLSLPSGSGWGILLIYRHGSEHKLYSLRLLLRSSKVANCDLRARYSAYLFIERGDNRVNDGGVLKLGDGEALLARVLQRRPHQVALGSVQDEETVVERGRVPDLERRVLRIEGRRITCGEAGPGVRPHGDGDAWLLLGEDVERSRVHVTVDQDYLAPCPLHECNQELERMTMEIGRASCRERV
mgnify:CR=1 FL=1